MKISITFTPPLSDVAANWQRLASAGIYESIARLGQEADQILLQALQVETPVRTGALRDNEHSTQRPNGRGVSFEYTSLDYGALVVSGTQPHIIEPVSARVLAWLGADGEMHFAKRVQHPGTQPNDFPMRAWQSARGDIMDVFSRTGRELLDQVK